MKLFEAKFDDEDSFPGEESDTNQKDLFPTEDSTTNDDESFPGDDVTSDEVGAEDTDEKTDQVVDKATENPDKQGLIRSVPGARLVYKRESQDGTFEELWFYNSKDMTSSMQIRQQILSSGTDIKGNNPASEDGKQFFTLWSSGNGELLNIKGLPQ
jgi:hypothetical protein